MPVGYQVFSGVFAEDTLGDLQHAGIYQLVEIIGAHLFEQVHGSGLVDRVVNGTGDVHLLDIAGEGFRNKGGFLLPVIHGDDLLEGCFQMQPRFHCAILNPAEGGYDTGITGFDRGGAGEDEQNTEGCCSNQKDVSFFHRVSFLSVPGNGRYVFARAISGTGIQ